MAGTVSLFSFCSNRIDQGAERIKAIAHQIRVLSGLSLDFLLDSESGAFLVGQVPSVPKHSCKIVVQWVILHFRPQRMAKQAHFFQLFLFAFMRYNLRLAVVLPARGKIVRG